MPFADLPGVRLWYTDTDGDGTPVVVMHAASGTAESWVEQLPALTAAGYRCIAYDRRDWGRSQRDPAGQQPGTLADDLQALANHLRLDRFHLVGTAAGGIAALDYALAHPERLRTLVIADTVGGVQDPEYLELLNRLRTPEFRALPVELRELGPGYRATNPEGTCRWLTIAHASRPEQRPESDQPPRNNLTLSRLATLRLPVLALCGEADLISPPALMRLLAGRIPGCRFATIPEAGHAAHWEQPAVWNHLVLEFLAPH
jgi:pimeloyl-ACP methyl ester carboxylesterase